MMLTRGPPYTAKEEVKMNFMGAERLAPYLRVAWSIMRMESMLTWTLNEA